MLRRPASAAPDGHTRTPAQRLRHSGLALSNFCRRRGILYTMTTRDTETEIEADLMSRAAGRARTRPRFMARLLARFQGQHSCSEP